MTTKALTQNHELAVNIAKVILAILALSASAHLTIPLKPVPVTLQTSMVLIIGLSYSPALAISSVISYLLLGAIGAPVFTNFDSGIAKLFGPTGGYLFGFIIAAGSMSYLRQIYGESMIKISLYSALGTSIMLIFGVAWFSSFVGLEIAIYEGCIKLIPTGIIKAALVISIMGYLRKD